MRQPRFLPADTLAGLEHVQSEVLSSPIALLEHRLLLERQRAQQLAELAQSLEERIASEKQAAEDQNRELQSARDGLVRWRNTAQAVETQFIHLKDMYRRELELNSHFTLIKGENDTLHASNKRLANELSASKLQLEHFSRMHER